MKLGASKHMTSHRAAFNTYEVIIPRNVHLDDNNVVGAIRMESIIMEAIVKGDINWIHIVNVLHLPKLHANLISVSKFVSNGLKVHFNLNKWIIKYYDRKAIAVELREGNFYEILVIKVHQTNAANLVQSPMGDGALKFWYCRLGHLNVEDHMLQNMVSGMNIGKFSCLTSSLFFEVWNNIKLHFQTKG